MLGERGDTLIEVTFALAILGSVLLGCTSVAAAAYRLGETARERTSVADVAQEQMEALRGFRDNSLSANGGNWDLFRFGTGSPPTGYYGVSSPLLLTKPCQFQASPTIYCFHMELKTVNGITTWVPVRGDLTPTNPATSDLTVPTSWVEISASTPSAVAGGKSTADTPAAEKCGYEFEIHYGFDPIGGGPEEENVITTRLSNLNYIAGVTGGTCP